VSDQEPKNNEPPAELSSSKQPAAEESATPISSSDDKASPAQGKSSSGPAWLALLLVIALAGGVAWLVRESQDRETLLATRVAHLETVSSKKETNLDAASARWEQELKTSVGNLKTAMSGESSKLSQSMTAVKAQLAEQRKELARFSASDRDSWLLAEVEYLLRLANQRLIMAGDTVATQALLASADSVLKELDEANLHKVRAAVAADLAVVRAVPKVDVEGIYLRLSALIEQAGKLVIFQLPTPEARPPEGAAANWQGRLRQGYEAALSKLSNYLIIRRRDVPMQALMEPQWEGLVRQNMRMLLEQAQVALLSKNQALYADSLGRASHWVDQFIDSDEVAARAIDSELKKLAGLTIAVPLPDISRSLQALDNAIERRLQQGGDE
jgi:uroporphyrin-3 C-methyltransferase